MTAKVPDWTSALVADLPRGRLTLTTSQEARVVALPGSVLGALVAVGGAAMESAADALGDALAGDVKAFLGGVDDPGPEASAHALSWALGLRGLGTGSFERWGDALLLVLHDPPAGGLGLLVARSAARAVSMATGVPAQGVVIASDGEAVSVLLTSAETASAVHAMVSAGLGRAAVLARLHGG